MMGALGCSPVRTPLIHQCSYHCHALQGLFWCLFNLVQRNNCCYQSFNAYCKNLYSDHNMYWIKTNIVTVTTVYSSASSQASLSFLSLFILCNKISAYCWTPTSKTQSSEKLLAELTINYKDLFLQLNCIAQNRVMLTTIRAAIAQQWSAHLSIGRIDGRATAI